MEFSPFLLQFPEIGPKQLRVINLQMDLGELPKGEYGFVNLYCEDKKCDCRRTMIYVLAQGAIPGSKPLAIISYGWESKAFYKNWAPHFNDLDIMWFKGPALDPYQYQSKHGAFFLELFKEALKDSKYKERLIRHYVMFKQKMGMKLPKNLVNWSSAFLDCGCGSGLKFKFCCGKGLK